MWRKYKRRVLLAMSSQAFAQLVSLICCLEVSARLIYRIHRMELMVKFTPFLVHI
jgi:hypothetical protein